VNGKFTRNDLDVGVCMCMCVCACVCACVRMWFTCVFSNVCSNVRLSCLKARVCAHMYVKCACLNGLNGGVRTCIHVHSWCVFEFESVVSQKHVCVCVCVIVYVCDRVYV
jgi:hypothetical protein